MSRAHYSAENGERGKGSHKQGKQGKDLIIHVPCGTEVYKNQYFFADITRDGQRMLVCRGGARGKGSKSFKSMSSEQNYAIFMELLNNSPALYGEPGEEAELSFKLKSLGHLGLVGFPNAGKSSLLAAVSNAKPKIAAYAFTTLSPSVGVLKKNGKKIYIADIPGITETDSSPELNGIVSKQTHNFLQHIERTSGFIYVVAVPSEVDLGGIIGEEDIESKIVRRMVLEFGALIDELDKYQKGLSKRKATLVINKVDVLQDMLCLETDEAIKLAEEIGLKILTKNNITSDIHEVIVTSITEGINNEELKSGLYNLYRNAVKESEDAIVWPEAKPLKRPFGSSVDRNNQVV